VKNPYPLLPCVILNEVKNPFLSHTCTFEVNTHRTGFFVARSMRHTVESDGRLPQIFLMSSCVTLNKMKNPYPFPLCHSERSEESILKPRQYSGNERTIGWILRGAFRNTQNDTLKKRLLPFSIVYYPNKVKSRLFLPLSHSEQNEKSIPFPPCVILNEVKNPYSSHTRTVEVKEPQDWILRLAFGKSQNDTGGYIA
jgi:hypothetical protein